MVERYLPEDIVFDILIWLPVKSLIRFTCVSKKWRCKILYDPEFAKSQFRASKNLSRHRLFLYSGNSTFCELRGRFVRDHQIESLDLPFAENSSDRKLNNIPMHEDDKIMTLLGSSNGLVFLQVRYSRGIHIFISNPSTGFFKKLPDPGFQIYLNIINIEYTINYVGVGYLSATDDYKVLVSHFDVLHTRKDIDFGDEVVELYSLRANLVKRIKRTDWYNFEVDGYGRQRQGTYLNESLHWIGHYNRYSTNKCYNILVFDLAKEEFRTMQLPDDFENIKYDYGKKVGTLGVSSGDCLCISSYPKDTCEESIDLWIMREYGMPGSWTKLTLSCPNRHTILSQYLDVLFMDSSTVVVNPTSRGTDFIRIEHKEDGKIALYTIKDDTYDKVIDYEESIVWIDDYPEEKVQKETQTQSQEASQSSIN